MWASPELAAQAREHRALLRMPRLGTPVRPRPADHGVRALGRAPALPRLLAGRRRRSMRCAMAGRLRIAGRDGTLVLLPVETAMTRAGPAPTGMLISAARAATLQLINQRDAAVPDAPVLIRAAEPFTLDGARRLSDPSRDLNNPLAGPFQRRAAGGCRGGAGRDGAGADRGDPARLPGRADPAGEAVEPVAPAIIAAFGRSGATFHPAARASADRTRPKTPRSSPFARPTTCASMSRWSSARRLPSACRWCGCIPNA